MEAFSPLTFKVIQDCKLGSKVWELELSLIDKNLCNILQFVGDLPWGIGLDYIVSLTVLSLNDSFFYVFSSIPLHLSKFLFFVDDFISYIIKKVELSENNIQCPDHIYSSINRVKYTLISLLPCIN